MNLSLMSDARRYLDLTDTRGEGLEGVQQLPSAPPEVVVRRVRSELLDKHQDKARLSELANLRLEQQEIMNDKRGREQELMDLQRAEELHRESLIEERDERDKLVKDLFSLKRSHLAGLQKETQLELVTLQEEREMLLQKEREKLEAIQAVREAIMSQDQEHHDALEEANARLRQQAESGGPVASVWRGEKEEIVGRQVQLARKFGTSTEGLRKERLRLEDDLCALREELDSLSQQGLENGEDSLHKLLSDAGLKSQEERIAHLKKAYLAEMKAAVESMDGVGGQLCAANGGHEETEGIGDLLAQEFLDKWLKADEEEVTRDALMGERESEQLETSQSVSESKRVQKDTYSGQALESCDEENPPLLERGEKPSSTEGESQPQEDNWQQDGHTKHGQESQEPLHGPPTGGPFDGAFGMGPGGSSGYLPQHPLLSTSVGYPGNPYLAAVEAENMRLMQEMHSLSQGLVPFNPAGGPSSFPQPAPLYPPHFSPPIKSNTPTPPASSRKSSDGIGGRLHGSPTPELVALSAVHEEEMLKLQFEIKELEMRKRLEDMKEIMKGEQEANAKALAHEKWLEDQKRELQALKMKKILAKERQLAELVKAGTTLPHQQQSLSTSSSGQAVGLGSVIQRPYNQNLGLSLLCDYVTGLPKKRGRKAVGKVRVALGVYLGTKALSKRSSTAWVSTKALGDALMCTLSYSRTFEYLPSNPQARVMVEVQFKNSKTGESTAGRSSPESLGWASLHLFRPEKRDVTSLGLRAGMICLPLMRGSVDLRVGAYNILTAEDAIGKVFLRVVHAQDISNANSFIVDAATAHLYKSVLCTPAERVKLWRGVCWRIVIFLCNLKYRVKQKGRKPAASFKTRVDNFGQKNQMGEDEKERRAEMASMRRELDSLRDQLANRPGDIPNEEREAPKQVSQQKEGEEEKQGSSRKAARPTKVLMDKKEQPQPRKRSLEAKTPFTPGKGFDVYVDGARGLPSSCTISKAVLRVFALDTLNDEGVHALSSPMSYSKKPMYHLRREFREPAPSALLTLLVKIETVERQSAEVKVVGYTAFPVFCDEQGRQPTSAEWGNSALFLNKGNFEIPLYSRPPSDVKNIVDGCFDDVRRVPCATVLLRIRECARSEDGESNLSDKSVPKEFWEKLKVVEPAPKYLPGVYENSRAPFSEGEVSILSMTEDDERISIVAHLAFNPDADDGQEGVPEYEESNSEPFIKWMESAMATKGRKMVDYRWSAKYNPDKGFSFRLAGLVNMAPGGSKKYIFKVVYSLLLPGFYYQDPPLTDQADFTLKYDLTSSQSAPRFMDEPKTYEHVNHDLGQCIIIDVRCIRIEKNGFVPEQPSTKRQLGGWGIIPVFTLDGYIGKGTYLVPLVVGPFPVDMLDQEKPVEAVIDNLRNKNYKLLEGSMAVVQIINPMLPSLTQNADMDRASLIHVRAAVSAAGGREDKFPYKWESGPSSKPISKLVPKKTDPDAFFKAANLSFAEATGVTKYPAEDL